MDALPEHDWSVIKAGIAVGYSRAYATTNLVTRAKHNTSLCKAIEQKRQEIQAEAAQERGWTAEWWRREQADALAIAKEKGDVTGINVALRQIGQHLGVFEADNHQRRNQMGMVIM